MPDLSASALTAAFYLQKARWADSNRKTEYIAECNIAKALIENTTADIKEISSSDKKLKVKIYWNDFTAAAPGTVAPDFCTISGNEADSDSKEYEIDTHVTQKFTIDEALYEDNNLSMEESFADNMMKCKKSLDEKIAQVLVSKLDAMTSPNLNTEVGVACPDDPSPLSWATSWIEPSKWTPEIMHYFVTTARKNKFTAPILIDGKNLNYKMWEAMMNAANANGAGASQMLKQMKYYEDIINIEAIAPGKTFMLNRGVTAFASRSRWKGVSQAAPILEPEISRKKWSDASDNIPGMVYDVYMTTDCSGAYKKHNVLIHGMYGLYNGPAASNGATGVLEFKCGPCPA